jgi:mannose-6-phosphate isomerase-like protein (cupin superfamily)
MKSGKVWGTTELMLRTPLVEIHRLRILPNMQCSMHKHNFKHNAFIVVEGHLTIETKKLDYALTDITELDPEDMTTVKPGEFHRFRSGSIGCTAFEIYYCEPLSEDIIRADVGGAT